MTAMQLRQALSTFIAGTIAALGLPAAALAAAPQPWQMNLQPSVTPVMTKITEFHDMLLWLTTVIAVFVLILLLYTIRRFSAKRNPTPSKNTHNTMLEMAWTVLPVVILVAIAVPSFRLLYLQDVIPKADMTIKAIGHQWYWSYEYPDHGKFAFDAQMVADEDIKKGQHRLLETDNRIVLPVNTTVRIIVTADDVIHSWTIPAFGSKIDAVPGRLNETWVRVEKTGTYYGQCSELCGVNHGFMPIAVDVVSKNDFAKWVKSAQKKFAREDSTAPENVARLAEAAKQ